MHEMQNQCDLNLSKYCAPKTKKRIKREKKMKSKWQVLKFDKANVNRAKYQMQSSFHSFRFLSHRKMMVAGVMPQKKEKYQFLPIKKTNCGWKEVQMCMQAHALCYRSKQNKDSNKLFVTWERTYPVVVFFTLTLLRSTCLRSGV